MPLDDFRILHSKLIEQYQLVEHHLEGLFGLLEKGDFIELTKRVENDAIGELIRKVRFLVKENHIEYLDKEDFNNLEKIRNDRNYWCHENFLDLNKDATLFKDMVIRINNDYKLAKEMNDKLRDTFIKLK